MIAIFGPLFCAVAVAAARLDVRVLPSDGSYTVLVDGAEWFRSAPVRLHTGGSWHSSADGSLQLSSVTATEGTDSVGAFVGTTVCWATAHSRRSASSPPPPAAATATTRLETRFRRYAAAELLVFEQAFPDGAANTSLGDEDLLVSEFPSFDLSVPAATAAATVTATAAAAPPPPRRAFYQWAGSGVPANNPLFGAWPPPPGLALRGGQNSASGALAIFDSSSSSSSGSSSSSSSSSASATSAQQQPAAAIYNRTAVVASPFSNFTSTMQVHDPAARTLSWGVFGRVRTVPAGHRCSTALQLGDGINGAMRRWGGALLRRSGKAPNWAGDFSLNYLGYTTANGAFYYYNTLPDKSYEDWSVNELTIDWQEN